ncbi:gamma-glutamylcyclotransferase family protein [Actinacidiphila rubida]|uniref:Uncharacterized conserved protein YtfP, gamma-glutamylcyclotransferase (GGCT)/AIG2-like family n=1 Tax=Actinacidiphila rubida TaxID=310780 RepID=A0A1H8F8G2_9ACTN|nr:gamma-glutamylcyclotransferase family protein [Actinacidiphila rubida]SEN28211.1 Uncharacterized conserved protein YtfP, gamma-glutamylcyclotransferase (GGCT)/AIG2-like family [Actinacidiphila rubida]
MTERRLPFFVYGTLRAGQRNHGLLRGRTGAWTPATLPGALLFQGPGYPIAVLDPAGTGAVHGDLVDVAAGPYAEVLADLDMLESYRPGDPAGLYLRVARAVRTARGTREAWVYVAPPERAAGLLARARPLPTGTWPAGPAS